MLVFAQLGTAAGDKKGPWLSWIFIDDTDKIKRGLIVLFFALVFTVGAPHLVIFLPTPLIYSFST